MSRFITVYRPSSIGVNRGHTGTVRTGLNIDIDIDIEDLFYVEYIEPENISSEELLLRQTFVK